ncbi:hypothetical protein Aduo_001191 [Ancylostoma duodenale]
MCEENSARIAILEEEIQELRKTVESLAAHRSDEEKAADVPEANGSDVMAGDDAPVEENRMEVAEQNQEERSDEPTSSNARNLHSRIRRVNMHNNHPHSPYEIVRYCHFCDQVGYSDSCRNVLGSAQRAEIVRAEHLCQKCLKRDTGVCKKITPCAYCSNNSHHRALCNAAIAFEERAKKVHHC